MNPVYASLLDSVRTLLFPEARTVGGQRVRQPALIDRLPDESSDHGVLGGSDQVQVFPVDLIHHIIHLGK